MATRGNSRPTPVGKQRVRTGCQTCRRRRRKCDERKPRCEACELKGFACKYGTDLTFVLQNKFVVEPTSVTPHADASTASGQNQAGGGSRHALVPAEPVARPDPRRSIAMAPDMEAIHSSHRGVSVETREPRNDIPPVGSGKSRSYNEPDDYGERTGASLGAFEGLSEIPISGITGSQLEAISGASSHTGRPSTGASFTYTSPPPLPSRDPDVTHEAGLLSHYRYHVAPWLDIAGAEATFGIGVLILARDKDSRPLFAAILALAALHRAVFNTPLPVHQNPSEWSILRYRYRQEAESGLRFVDREIRSVGTSLLILDEVLSSGPGMWRGVLLSHIEAPGILPALSQLVGETDEAVFGLYFRIDLAASLASGTAPLLPYDSYLTEDGSMRNILTGPSINDPTRSAFRQAILLLACALTLTYNGHQEPHTNEDYIDASTFASARLPTLSERWTLLWNKCQRWYATRPTEVQQILDVRGVEVDQIDPHDASSFPIIVYTTPLALVANVVYHVTSLLLLLHRPRLLKPLAGPRCLTSCIWHAQSIAGIAVSNDSPEQYDPILISGLFLAAKDMTHISQQTTVLECLGRITACTGIRLDREVEDLKSIWNIAAFNESGM